MGTWVMDGKALMMKSMMSGRKPRMPASASRTMNLTISRNLPINVLFCGCVQQQPVQYVGAGCGRGKGPCHPVPAALSRVADN